MSPARAHRYYRKRFLCDQNKGLFILEEIYHERYLSWDIFAWKKMLARAEIDLWILLSNLINLIFIQRKTRKFNLMSPLGWENSFFIQFFPKNCIFIEILCTCWHSSNINLTKVEETWWRINVFSQILTLRRTRFQIIYLCHYWNIFRANTRTHTLFIRAAQYSLLESLHKLHNYIILLRTYLRTTCICAKCDFPHIDLTINSIDTLRNENILEHSVIKRWDVTKK